MKRGGLTSAPKIPPSKVGARVEALLAEIAEEDAKKRSPTKGGGAVDGEKECGHRPPSDYCDFDLTGREGPLRDAVLGADKTWLRDADADRPCATAQVVAQVSGGPGVSGRAGTGWLVRGGGRVRAGASLYSPLGTISVAHRICS